MRMNTSLIRRIAFSALLLCLPSGAMPQTIASNTAYHVVRSPSGVFSLVREAAASPRYLASSGAIKTKNLRPAIAQPMFSGSVFSPAVNFASGGSLPLGVAAAVLRTQLANAPADVVLADCGSNAVAVLLGNGDGTLQAPVTYSSGGSCPQAVVIADVNADGIPDLVLSNQGGGPHGDGSVAILLGNGDGTFQSAGMLDSGGTSGNQNLPSGLVVADFNGDKIPDIVVANQSGMSDGDGSVAVLLGSGGGNFSPAVVYDSSGFTATALVAADANGDGYPDLLIANNCTASSCSPQQGSVAVLLNFGSSAPGTFAAAVTYVTPGPASTLAAGNLGSGFPDLLVGLGTYGTAVLMNNADGSGAYQAAQGLGGLGQISAVAIHDVNGDGINDLVIGLGYCGGCDNGNDSGVAFNLGAAGGSFQGWSTPVDSAGVLVTGLAFADFNGDGIPDLVGANSCDSGNIDNFCSGTAAVFLDSAASLATALTASPNPADLNQTVTYTATVTNPTGAVTGTITFRDGTTVLSTQSTSTGAATLTETYKSTGTHSITAQFAPNGYEYSLSPLVVEPVVAKTTTRLTTSGSPSFVGQAITFTATITATKGEIPDGEAVTFSDPSGSLGSATTVGGVATLTTASLPAGTTRITATYAGDTTFGTSAGTVSQQVDLNSSTTSLASSSNPSTYGQSVTFSATVSSGASAAPTGIVTFKNGATVLGTSPLTSGGSALLTTSALTTGTPSIVAIYGGDSANGKSTSPPLLQTVTQAKTNSSLSASAASVTYGQPVTFTATVTSNTGTPVSGNVSFTFSTTTSNNNPITGCGAVHLSNSSQASCMTSALPVDAETIVATYAGNANFTGSTAQVTETVIPEAPVLTLVSSNPNPVTYPDVLTFTASLPPMSFITVGKVSFTLGNKTITGCGAVALNGLSQASCVAELPAGTDTIIATYTGNANITGATAQLTETVNPESSSMTLSSNVSSTTYENLVTITAIVSDAMSDTGSVGNVSFTFSTATSNNNPITGCGAVHLSNNSQASCMTSALPVGADMIVATYSGNNNIIGSTAQLTETVNQAATTTSLSLTGGMYFGQSLSFTATVQLSNPVPSGGVPITGSVSFSADGVAIVGCTSIKLSSGAATCSTSALTLGSHTITASYAGNTDFVGSTAHLQQSVVQASSSMTLSSSSNPGNSGQPVTFTANLTSPFSPINGTVSFSSNGNTIAACSAVTVSSGAASCMTSTLAAGMDSIVASYAGSADVGPSTGYLTETIN